MSWSLFFGVAYLPQSLMWPAYFALWALALVYFVVVHRLVFRKMGELGISPEYQAAHRRARCLWDGGFLAFFILNTLGPFISR
jgi:hypothetical protein